MTLRAILREDQSSRCLFFEAPRRVIQARNLQEVPEAIRAAEAEALQGRYAAGFVAYEAAPAFDAALQTHPPAPDVPLAWFAVFDAPVRVVDRLPAPAQPPPELPWKPSETPDAYREAVARIKDWIAAGDTYQVNYTMRLHSPFFGDPEALFLQLAGAQGVGPAAYFETDEWAVCSASPELFFSRKGRCLVVRPMKGTAARGRWPEEDRAAAEALRASAKDRAENVMIVDMMRNDLGRLAEPGSVRVGALFDVERYPTVWQMTSTVQAETGAGLGEVFAALFPCASVTGAPKVRTMQLIRALEPAPRGVYTGAAGLIEPGGAAQFNVAIRTVWVDRRRKTAEYGVGGGIVWDSVAEAEYRECLVKARVLSAPAPASFALLETFRWALGQGFDLLEEHLDRLMASAAYWGYRADRERLRRRLEEASDTWADPARRVRLLVEADGAERIESFPLEGFRDEPVRLAFAPWPVDASDPFLYHKTTRRDVYERARAACPDADDVLLWNQAGECTETTVYNLAADLGGDRWVTPPLACGLLPGTLRRRLLEEGRLVEQVLPRAELSRARALYVFNSVRGIRPAVLC